MLYNRTIVVALQAGLTRAPASTRLLVAVVLFTCALTAGSSFGAAQAPAAEDLPFPQSARRLIAHGRLEEAEALARARPAGDPAAAPVLARIALVHGRYQDAQQLLEDAVGTEPAGEAALELGLLHRQLGRAEAADPLLVRVYRQASAGADGEALLRAARAAHALNRVRDANALYRAAAATGSAAPVQTAWGTLFLEKYNAPEALRSFKQALEADPRWAPAHVGLAQTLIDENPPEAAAAAERALEIDPLLADAHLLLASLDLDNTRYPEARARIQTVLDTNPSHLEARALLAAIAYVKDDRTRFEADVREVLALNPSFGEVYRVAADLSARNYRFDEAVALTRKAIGLDPSNTRAYADLGMHLMRTGDESEARRSLERAFKADPFDRVTYNLLALLDKLEKFEVIQDGDLVLKLHPEEAPVLKEYALPLAREALKRLSATYEFTPKGPILVEIFPQHDDFAVRNLGLPGLIGALGACFGRVVSMDSPRARPPGSFSWQATLWHELAHVVTLQMSNQRVPRWLTEGISVYEETRARPAWGRDMEVSFALALERGQVLKLSDLNSGFTRPETIALAYFQASQLVDHIVQAHGTEGLRKLLRAYGEGLEGETAISRALGVSLDQLQSSFDDAMATRYSAMRAALGGSEGKEPPRPGDIAALREAAAARPGSYQAQLAYGAALAEQGDRAAFEPLERAAALVPVATGENSPHAIMGSLAEQLGDAPRAIKEYLALLSNDHTAVEPARRLAALAAKAGDEQALAAAHERVVEIDPFDAQAHTGLGRLAIQERDLAVATREFRVALAIGPPDRAAAHCDLAKSYLLSGRRDEAKREALAALEIAPSFERAQDLLLRSIEGEAEPARPRGARR
ncbi:MAG TPA: tetratricopeptide repeat protein [Vicinamibacterales bacterium]|nr:tetratricopeptide repeat protein [Vicinamibacterales bacterium]